MISRTLLTGVSVAGCEPFALCVELDSKILFADVEPVVSPDGEQTAQLVASFINLRSNHHYFGLATVSSESHGLIEISSTLAPAATFNGSDCITDWSYQENATLPKSAYVVTLHRPEWMEARNRFEKGFLLVDDFYLEAGLECACTPPVFSKCQLTNDMPKVVHVHQITEGQPCERQEAEINTHTLGMPMLNEGMLL